MKESEFEIVRDQGLIIRIFEQMLEQRRPLNIIQHGHGSDAWCVRVNSSSLILAKRDKASRFTTELVEFQFRCVLGRNIAGKSRIVRLNDDYLELVLPAELTIIQRRQAFRVVPTADSIAIFQDAAKWLLSGRVENLSATGMLVLVPQTAPLAAPSDIQVIRLHLNHALPASDNIPHGTLERFLVTLEAANIVRKGDDGTTRFATYGINFERNLSLERQLFQVILRYERALLLKGLKV